jgi:hypothetical protein
MGMCLAKPAHTVCAAQKNLLAIMVNGTVSQKSVSKKPIRELSINQSNLGKVFDM